MIGRPETFCFGISSRCLCSAFLVVTGLVAISCAASPSPRQMYEGVPLPNEQIGIVRSGCSMGSGLTIMTMQIDGKEISDVCADFALLPGDHQIALSAKRLGPKLETRAMGSGAILGAPASPGGSLPAQGSQVIWTSPSMLRITCTVRAGREVTIVGTGGVGEEWQARCQERER